MKTATPPRDFWFWLTIGIAGLFILFLVTPCFRCLPAALSIRMAGG